MKNVIRVQSCHLPALVVNFVILANEILETHVFPALLLLVKEALAPGHVEHGPHSSLGEVLVLQDCRPQLLFS